MNTLNNIFQSKVQLQKMNYTKIVLVLLIVFLFSGCSIRKIVVGQLEPVVNEMQASILNEPEEIFVQGSLPFAIKFAESLYRYYPRSSYYSGKLALLYSAYTFAYFDETPYNDFDEDADAKIARLLTLYDKAYRFGIISMDARVRDFSTRILNSDSVDKLLSEVDKEDVETLFWLNFSWAMKILHQLSDTSELANLETVKKIADRINELDPDFFYGINSAIYIAYYGARVNALGGDRVKANEYYQKNLEKFGGRSLIGTYVYFRYVTVLSPDSDEFEEFYNRIKEFEIDTNSDFAFINTFVKRKAEELYVKKSWIFGNQ